MQFVYNKQNKIYILVVQIYIFVLRITEITEITVFRECNVETPSASLTLSSSLIEGALGKEVRLCANCLALSFAVLQL